MFKYIIVLCLLLIGHYSSAEIVIDYKVTVQRTNTLVDQRLAIPTNLIVTIGAESVRVQRLNSLVGASEFDIYPHEESFFYYCFDYKGYKRAIKQDRPMYDIAHISDSIFSIAGMDTKKATGYIGDFKTEIYFTDHYGIQFHSRADINGIALKYTEDHKVFGKIIYEMINISFINVPDYQLEVGDYKIVHSSYSNEKSNNRKGKAPSIQVRNQSNERVKLSFSNQELTVINFWFEGCKPCLLEMPYLNALVDKYENDSINFIAISLDSSKAIKKFLLTNNFKYQMYTDGKSSASKFQVNSYPAHFIINQSGEIVYKTFGYDAFSVYNLSLEIDKLLND